MTQSSLLDRLDSTLALGFTELQKVRWLAPLLGRLAVGLLFLSTGWGKVHNLDKVTAFFEKLNIPMPAFNAAFVGGTELVCGALLVVGLLTRLATVPLVISMIVAIATAKKDDLHGLFDLVGFEEFTYIVILLMIAILGPGEVALDRWLPFPRSRAAASLSPAR